MTSTPCAAISQPSSRWEKGQPLSQGQGPIGEDRFHDHDQTLPQVTRAAFASHPPLFLAAYSALHQLLWCAKTAVQPYWLHTIPILARITAIAICIQFHVSKYSIPCTAAMAKY